MPASHEEVEFVLLDIWYWETTLIRVAPYAPEKGTVIRIDAELAIPYAIAPTSSPGSLKSPSIFQSMYTFPPEEKLVFEQSPKSISIV